MKIKSELEVLQKIIDELKEKLGDKYDKTPFVVDFAENLWNIKQELKWIINNFIHFDDYYANSGMTVIPKENISDLNSFDAIVDSIKQKETTDETPYKVGISSEKAWIADEGASVEHVEYRPGWSNDTDEESDDEVRGELAEIVERFSAPYVEPPPMTRTIFTGDMVVGGMRPASSGTNVRRSTSPGTTLIDTLRSEFEPGVTVPSFPLADAQRAVFDAVAAPAPMGIVESLSDEPNDGYSDG